MIEDDVEVIIMSDKSCDDGSCGYTRPGGVAYRNNHFDFVLNAVATLTVSQMGFPAPRRSSYSNFQCPTPTQQASMLTCPPFGL